MLVNARGRSSSHGGLLPLVMGRDREDAISMSRKGIRRQRFIESAIPRASEVPRTNPVLPHHLLTVFVPYYDGLLTDVEGRLMTWAVPRRTTDPLHHILTRLA